MAARSRVVLRIIKVLEPLEEVGENLAEKNEAPFIKKKVRKMVLVYLVYESVLAQWSYRLDSKPIFSKDPFNFGQENSAAGAVKSMLMRL